MISTGTYTTTFEMTSASGTLMPRVSRHPVLATLFVVSVLGTSSAQALPEKIQSRTPRIIQTTAGQPITTESNDTSDVAATPSTAAQIAELRRLSGLTWDQLASLFDVSRRSLHFWASGKPMTAENGEHLSRVLSIIKGFDRGFAEANRAALLEDMGSGKLVLDLLANAKYKEVANRLGSSAPPRAIPPKLSNEVMQQRSQTLPVDVLMDALEDPVHANTGRARIVKPLRIKSAA